MGITIAPMTMRSSNLRRVITPGLSGALFYLSFFLSAGAYGPFLNLYFKELDFSGRQIGFLATCFPLMTLVSAPLLSALADRRNLRLPILQAVLMSGAIFIFLLQYPKSFGSMAVALFMMAVTFGPVMSIADGLIVNMAKRRALNYGGMRLWGSFGFAASSVVFGWLYQRYDLVSMFTISSGLMIPVLLLAGTLEEGTSPKLQEPQSLAVIVKDAGMVILILVSFLMGISNALTMSFESILVQHLGGSNFMVGLTFGVAGVGEILTMNYGHKIADRIRKNHALMLSIMILFLAYLGYLVAVSAWIILPLAVLRGLGFGLFFTNIVRLVNDRTPEEWVATAQSFRTMAMFGIAPLVASPLAGLVHDRVSPSAVFGIGVVSLGLAGIVLAWGALKRIFA